MAYLGRVSLKEFAPDHPFSKLYIGFNGKLPTKKKPTPATSAEKPVKTSSTKRRE